jgi:cystathionine beta-lyase
MPRDFDEQIDRSNSDSVKWRLFEEDVLPLWVADMDFPVPRAVGRAVQERAAHEVFGYAMPPKELPEVVQARLARLYDWHVEIDDILLLPGVVSGFNVACRAVGDPGDEILVEPPIYPPMLTAPGNVGRVCVNVPLVDSSERYERDLDAFEAAITERTSLFLLCSPHNPAGRVFSRDELEQVAAICQRHDVVICSDEIHCDIIFSGHEHVPIAAIDPEIAARTISLFAPSKTFNVPGLGCSVGIIQDADLREQFKKAKAGLVPHVNVFGYAAALAAFRDGQEWLDQLLVYLEANRDYLLAYIEQHWPQIRCHKPEGTFLAWLDCREAGLPGKPSEFFKENARVALNDGLWFGEEGEGFVRLNFGCPRATLTEALERMREALAEL